MDLDARMNEMADSVIELLSDENLEKSENLKKYIVMIRNSYVELKTKIKKLNSRNNNCDNGKSLIINSEIDTLSKPITIMTTISKLLKTEYSLIGYKKYEAIKMYFPKVMKFLMNDSLMMLSSEDRIKRIKDYSEKACSDFEKVAMVLDIGVLMKADDNDREELKQDMQELMASSIMPEVDTEDEISDEQGLDLLQKMLMLSIISSELKDYTSSKAETLEEFCEENNYILKFLEQGIIIKAKDGKTKTKGNAQTKRK
jgi:hypothetical protein